MRQFTKEALKTASTNVSDLYVRLANMRPDTDTLTGDEITNLMFYIHDYYDELRLLYLEKTEVKR